MKRVLSLVLIVLALVSVACAKPAPTPSPTPSPTTTSTFEQKRVAVVTYFKAFNSIYNSYADSLSPYAQCAFTANFQYLGYLFRLCSSVLDEVTVAFISLQARLAEVQTSPLAPETLDHLNQAKIVVAKQKQDLEAWQALEAARLNPRTTSAAFKTLVDLTLAQLGKADAERQKLNRTTEQLLLKYNISDEEVSYRYRGQ